MTKQLDPQITQERLENNQASVDLSVTSWVMENFQIIADQVESPFTPDSIPRTLEEMMTEWTTGRETQFKTDETFGHVFFHFIRDTLTANCCENDESPDWDTIESWCESYPKDVEGIEDMFGALVREWDFMELGIDPNEALQRSETDKLREEYRRDTGLYPGRPRKLRQPARRDRR